MADNQADAGPPPSVDVQDPLPESNFLWRRLFAFVVVSALLAFAAWHTESVGKVALEARSETAIKGLVSLLRLDLGLIALVVTYYLLAPSAEQMVRLIQAGRALREGVVFRRESTASSDGGTATTTAVAGAPALASAPAPAREDDEDAAPSSAR